MGVRTRSATSSPVKKSPSDQQSTAKAITACPAPLKGLIIPSTLSQDARIIQLRHPRDGARRQFLLCPRQGVHEITRMSVPSTDLRSMLITAADHEGVTAGLETPRGVGNSVGQVNQNAEILISTPFDPIFLLLPFLIPAGPTSRKAMFQPMDDLLELPDVEDRQFRYMLRKCKKIMEHSMNMICDTVDAGGETMFRYSEAKVLRILLAKAERTAQHGLPASLEEKFVTRALEAPVLSVLRNEISDAAAVESVSTPSFASSIGSIDSGETATSQAMSTNLSEISAPKSAATSLGQSSPDNILLLQRLRITLNFIMDSYLPTHLVETYQAIFLSADGPVDFKPLDERLKKLAALRAEAVATRSLADFSYKRGHVDDDEAAEDRAEKKRRLEEEEKRRKANESRGVRDLKKVNVAGMKKMTNFFTKAAPSAKAKT